MAEQALGPGAPMTPRRALFGLLDAGGWGWASIKAVVWFLLIILLLGYLPDRALYATVQPTIDLGLALKSIAPALDVTPVNFCPAGNQSLPCPAPAGALLPWQLTTSEDASQLFLPAPRTHAAIVQAGLQTLLIGGSDGTAPQASVFTTIIHPTGNFDSWATGPALPAARSDAAAVFFNGAAYVIGGFGPDGKPTDTVWSGTPDAATGAIATWKEVAGLKLPAPRAGASVAVASDGLFLVGGSDGSGPTTTVWKATLNATSGAISKWADQAPLAAPRVHASAVVVGNFVFVYGGELANQPTNVTMRATLSTAKDTLLQIVAPADPTKSAWEVSNNTVPGTTAPADLPAARFGAVGFTANGTLYYAGGIGQGANDDTAGEVYWTTPDANGNINGWNHLVQSDLPKSQDLQYPSAIVSGSEVFLVGGSFTSAPGQHAVTSQSVRANLAPAPPFFQVGLFYVVTPAMGIQGPVGQQLSYLSAAGVGTIDFVLLLLVGYALNHRERTREVLARLRRRRGAARG